MKKFFLFLIALIVIYIAVGRIDGMLITRACGTELTKEYLKCLTDSSNHYVYFGFVWLRYFPVLALVIMILPTIDWIRSTKKNNQANSIQ